ncbi:MAG: SIS domain-containing protein [Candidatus Omnitrophica bacterium]|nr:SIS domain-containing protein [Candidatus Omnitrophota bacterium]MDE2223587.1 SIS domain-containing protein [Candidatus Omnitrophota bacterium]
MMDWNSRLKAVADHMAGVDPQDLQKVKELVCAASAVGGKVIIAGNGASAAIASHVAVDLTKSAGVRALNFNEADLITCLANDYGYEHWVEKALELYADGKDVAVLISSSGQSANIVNAARRAKALGLKVVTLSGFSKDNPLRKLGDINLWVNSSQYNIVETVHQTWLLIIVDRIAEDKGTP